MDKFIIKESASLWTEKTEETLDSRSGFARYPDSGYAEGTGLYSVGNDILVLFIFAVTKYGRETSSQRGCLSWLTASEVLICETELNSHFTAGRK